MSFRAFANQLAAGQLEMLIESTPGFRPIMPEPEPDKRETWCRTAPGCFERTYTFGDLESMRMFVDECVDLLDEEAAAVRVTMGPRSCQVRLGDPSVGHETGLERELIESFDELYRDCQDTYSLDR